MRKIKNLLSIAALSATLFIVNAARAEKNTQKFEDFGGVKLRQNINMKSKLLGYSWVYVSSYNGGSSGGISETAKLSFCAPNFVSLSSESLVTMNVPGLGGSNGSSENDSGTFAVYEDTKGNLFLRLTLSKTGDQFMHFRFVNNKIVPDNNKPFTKYQKVC